MTAAALIARLLCNRCGWPRIDAPCPCQTRDHARRTRAEAAQRAENADRYAFTDLARQRRQEGR